MRFLCCFAEAHSLTLPSFLPSPEPWMGQESMDVAVQPSTSFPVAVNVDAGPQPMPEATTQVLTAVPKAACAGGPSLCFSSHFPFSLGKGEIALRSIFGESFGRAYPGFASLPCLGVGSLPVLWIFSRYIFYFCCFSSLPYQRWCCLGRGISSWRTKVHHCRPASN